MTSPSTAGHGKNLSYKPVDRHVLLDLGDGYGLRPALSSDHAALSDICLRTADAGRDATAREDDPSLLGLIYAIPYQTYAPDFAFVVDGPRGVCGYVLGAPDSAAFYAWATAEWFPPIAAGLRDPGPDEEAWRGSDWARRAIHHPRLAYPGVLHPFPAHGHIDLLEETRGRRIGTRIIGYLMRQLRDAGVPGLHLQVNPRNRGALKFYETLGMRRLEHPSLPRDSAFMVTEL